MAANTGRRLRSIERLLPMAMSWGVLFSAFGAPMVTRWSKEVGVTNVLPEYPRPQLVRDSWQNLNGQWDYAIVRQTDPQPSRYQGKILVPFPVESHLSGVGQALDENSVLWYRRHFTIPDSWRGQRVLLHFGAVDWETKVFLNGRFLGVHRGGYDPFSFNLSEAIRWNEPNELVVSVWDPTEGDQPRGKQSRKPEGIFYLASSGIWQTVWLEPVPPVGIAFLKLTTDFRSHTLKIGVLANSLAEDLQVDVAASFAGELAGRTAGLAGAELSLPLRLIRPWSPARPDLYDLEVTLRRGSQVLDRVRSYFGLRDIQLCTDASGARRLCLNGEPLFQMGVLDQGFWPDGLHTAPSDEALRFDLETARHLGFNLVRKHVKVEPERWYYWADKLGMLVWQDMPSGNNATEAGRRQFEMELMRLVEQRGNHPSVVMWVLFNEGWGQFETERLVRRLKTVDPSRLVNNASGWTDMKVGDVLDLHSYPDPAGPVAESHRAGVLGEFGGLGLGVTNHTWSTQTPWGYRLMPDADKLATQYGLLLDKVWGLQKSNGLAAAVYTQLTDVETECNGFLTYDREVLKVDPLQVRFANQNPQRIFADAREQPALWSYTTRQPGPEWMQLGFDASDWPTGLAGFGTRQGPNVIVQTTWETPEIWLRRDFVLGPEVPPPLVLTMYHDEDVEVYLNGVLALRETGYSVSHKVFTISPEAQAALRPGRNVVAVHCRQTTGGQFIDVGLVLAP